MCMKTNCFYLLLFLFVLSGCSDRDVIIPETPPTSGDVYEGPQDQVTFSNETEDFSYGELTFYFKTPDGSIIHRNAKHQRFSGVSHFSMERGLKEGKYLLLYLEYTVKSECPDINGLKRKFGLCCKLNVTKEGIQLESTYAGNAKLFGSGTQDDPYLISSSEDLTKIRYAIQNGVITSSSCFSQVHDINMDDYNKQCGWEGNWYQIGQSSTHPFTGYYFGNGYKILNLTMSDQNKVGASLFGYIDKAVIMDLEIYHANITGLSAVSAIAGAVVTSGSGRDASFIKGCKVTSSVIAGRQKDGLAVGGIVGCVDPDVKLWIDSCSVETTYLSGAIAVGGILGGANLRSATQITNSHNSNGTVDALYTNAGGIVGYADSLYVYLCTNSSSVTGYKVENGKPAGVPSTSLLNLGTGGIVGGSGISTIITCSNEGKVSGYRGVGGILGSTLVSVNPEASYNNTFVGYCSNKGTVKGDSYVGGLCGEAQLAVYKSYNDGAVEAANEYAGGVIGMTPLSTISNSVNFAPVSASGYAGGMSGTMMTGSLALDVNMGPVSVKGSHVGGMIGIGGSCLAVNYCANFANLSGNTRLGGIIGEVGDKRVWTTRDKISAIFASAEFLVSVAGVIPIPGFVGKSGKAIIEAVFTTHDLVMTAVNYFTLEHEFKHLLDPIERKVFSNTLSGLMAMGMETLESDMDQLLVSRLSVSFKDKDLRRDEMINVFMKNRADVVKWYETGSNHEIYRDAMNYKRDARYEHLLKRKQVESIAHSLVDGVCFYAGTVAMVVGMVATPATGGLSLVLSAAGVVISGVGYANSMIALADDFAENAVVVTQCVSFGNMNVTSSEKYNGGLVGELAQNCLVSDCLNGSDGHVGGALVGHPERVAKLKNCLNVGYGWPNMAYTDALGSRYENLYYWNGSSSNYYDETIFYGLKLDQLNNKKSYSGWDFSVRWSLPDTNIGSFPVPYQSEMQYEKPKQ